MGLYDWLMAGAALCMVVMVVALVAWRRLAVYLLYALCLPAWALAWMVSTGRTSLDWVPVVVAWPLMYFTAPSAVVTVLILVVVGLPQLLPGSSFDGRYATNVAYGLACTVPLFITLYLVVNDQWVALLWHLLGSACGVALASVARGKFSTRSTDPFNR